MRKDQEAYRQMYALIRPVVRHKQVLELAAGTGLIAKNIVHSADHIEATDASEEMIRQAKQGAQSAKLHFSVQDMFCLPMLLSPSMSSSYPTPCISYRNRKKRWQKYTGC